jgi:hypothetical protein
MSKDPICMCTETSTCGICLRYAQDEQSLLDGERIAELEAEVRRLREGIEKAIGEPGHRYLVEIDGADPISVVMADDLHALLEGEG